jgi:hypothetical protein
MILNMQEDSTRKWIATVVASSSKNSFDKNSNFSRMVAEPNWDEKAIDFRITMNGYEFTALDNLFDRLHGHMVELSDRIVELEYENQQLRAMV